MKKITALVDYRDSFCSKHFATPYRSGFDHVKLIAYFKQYSYQLKIVHFSEIDFKNQSFKNQSFIYTSQEDEGFHYKNYIEDVVYALELNGAKVLPDFKYMKANNNKVFMEQLRDQHRHKNFNNITAYAYGSYEEFINHYPFKASKVVIKTAEGSSGKGVYLAEGKANILKTVKRISRTKYPKFELWDLGRSLRHKGYRKESKHRKKFIIQQYIPNLKNDWKIYVFGERVYIFYRPIFKERGFRASGGGYDNYFYGSNAPKEDGLLDFARDIFNTLDTPSLSIDVGYDGKQFYLFEFQCLHFGTAGIPYSKEYYVFKNNEWKLVKEDLEQEKVYVDSIVQYLEK